LLKQLYLSQALLKVAVGGDGVAIAVGMGRIDTPGQGPDLVVRIEVQEEGGRIAGDAPALRGWIDHPVGGRRQAVVGQALQHVADVADQRTGRRIDGQPAAVTAQHLQPGLFGAEQQGDDVDVLVGCGADMRPLARGGRIVQQPQDRVPVIDGGREEVALQAQIDGQRLKHLQPHGVESAVQPADLFAEPGDVSGPDIGRHHRGIGMALGQVPAHVPELLQVMMGLALGGLHAERGVAPLSALADHIGALGLFRQGEKGLGGKQVWLRDRKRNQSLYYAHLDSIANIPGSVKRGDTLGFVGNTGNARTTPPHLHFGIYKSYRGAINPLYFVYQASSLQTEPEKLDNIPHKLIVQSSKANLRNKPTTSNSRILSTLKAQDTLQFLGKTREWFHVRTSANKASFIHQSLVTPIAP